MGCSSLWWLMVERLNPHPSHETKARRMGHPEIQLRKFECCGGVCHPPVSMWNDTSFALKHLSASLAVAVPASRRFMNRDRRESRLLDQR
jgi:hypothetical protein